MRPKAAALLLLALVVPEALARLRLRASAPEAGVFELYAAGDSTAAGEPFDRRLSFPVLAAARFPDGIGGRPVKVVALARPGDSMYPQSIAIREAMRHRRRSNPAAVLIYCGHNERLSAGREAARLENAWMSARGAVMKRSAFAAWAIPSAERALGARGPRSLTTYERDMRSAIEASLEAGATPVLSTLVSNISQVEPAIDCSGGLSRPDCMAPLEEFLRAREAEKAGDFAAARRGYWAALARDPGRGFGRGTPAQNESIRRLAAEYGIPLVDSVASFEAKSPRGLLGPGLFSDGHHPSLEGHLLLADGFAAALARKFGARAAPAPSPKEALARARYDATDLAAARLYSGRWLLTVSVGHPSPKGRLALAERAFAEAAALDPADPRPKLGLELVATDAGGAWLMKEDAASRIAPLGRPRN